MNKYIYIVLFSFTFGVMSCGIDDKQLSPEERYTVDTLFSTRLNELRIYTDSLCNAQRDTLFAHYTDSMKFERLKEIEALLIINPEQE